MSCAGMLTGLKAAHGMPLVPPRGGMPIKAPALPRVCLSAPLPSAVLAQDSPQMSVGAEPSTRARGGSAEAAAHDCCAPTHSAQTEYSLTPCTHPAGDGDRSPSMRSNGKSAACACTVAVRHGAAGRAPLAVSRARGLPLQPGWAALLESGRVCPWRRSSAVGRCGGGEPFAADSGAGRWSARNSARAAAVGRRTLSSAALATRAPLGVVGYTRSAWAHICTGLAAATSPPGLGLSAAHLHRARTYRDKHAHTHTHADTHTQTHAHTHRDITELVTATWGATALCPPAWGLEGWDEPPQSNQAWQHMYVS